MKTKQKGWFHYHPKHEPTGDWHPCSLTDADKKGGWSQRAAYVDEEEEAK